MLNADPSSRSSLLVAVHGLPAECGLCTSLSTGLPRWSFLALLPLSCFKHVWRRFLGCLPLLCGASHALFLFLSSSSVVGSRSATSHLANAMLSARNLHHCIRQLSCGLPEVWLQNILDLTASHRLGHLCLPLHLWSHCSFLRGLDRFLELQHVEEFPGCPHFTWDIFLLELEMQILRLFSLKSHAPYATERQCLIQRLLHNLAGDRIDPNSFFHDLVVCWRNGEASV